MLKDKTGIKKHELTKINYKSPKLKLMSQILNSLNSIYINFKTCRGLKT